MLGGGGGDIVVGVAETLFGGSVPTHQVQTRKWEGLVLVRGQARGLGWSLVGVTCGYASSFGWGRWGGRGFGGRSSQSAGEKRTQNIYERERKRQKGGKERKREWEKEKDGEGER